MSWTQLEHVCSFGLFANYFCSHTFMHSVISSFKSVCWVWNHWTPSSVCDIFNKTVFWNVKSYVILDIQCHIYRLQISLIYLLGNAYRYVPLYDSYFMSYKTPYNPFPNSNATDGDLCGSNNKHCKIGNKRENFDLPYLTR